MGILLEKNFSRPVTHRSVATPRFQYSSGMEVAYAAAGMTASGSLINRFFLDGEEEIFRKAIARFDLAPNDPTEDGSIESKFQFQQLKGKIVNQFVRMKNSELKKLGQDPYTTDEIMQLHKARNIDDMEQTVMSMDRQRAIDKAFETDPGSVFFSALGISLLEPWNWVTLPWAMSGRAVAPIRAGLKFGASQAPIIAVEEAVTRLDDPTRPASESAFNIAFGTAFATAIGVGIGSFGKAKFNKHNELVKTARQVLDDIDRTLNVEKNADGEATLPPQPKEGEDLVDPQVKQVEKLTKDIEHDRTNLARMDRARKKLIKEDNPEKADVLVRLDEEIWKKTQRLKRLEESREKLKNEIVSTQNRAAYRSALGELELDETTTLQDLAKIDASKPLRLLAGFTSEAGHLLNTAPLVVRLKLLELLEVSPQLKGINTLSVPLESQIKTILKETGTKHLEILESHYNASVLGKEAAEELGTISGSSIGIQHRSLVRKAKEMVGRGSDEPVMSFDEFKEQVSLYNVGVLTDPSPEVKAAGDAIASIFAEFEPKIRHLIDVEIPRVLQNRLNKEAEEVGAAKGAPDDPDAKSEVKIEIFPEDGPIHVEIGKIEDHIADPAISVDSVDAKKASVLEDKDLEIEIDRKTTELDAVNDELASVEEATRPAKLRGQDVPFRVINVVDGKEEVTEVWARGVNATEDNLEYIASELRAGRDVEIWKTTGDPVGSKRALNPKGQTYRDMETFKQRAEKQRAGKSSVFSKNVVDVVKHPFHIKNDDRFTLELSFTQSDGKDRSYQFKFKSLEAATLAAAHFRLGAKGKSPFVMEGLVFPDGRLVSQLKLGEGESFRVHYKSLGRGKAEPYILLRDVFADSDDYQSHMKIPYSYINNVSFHNLLEDLNINDPFNRNTRISTKDAIAIINTSPIDAAHKKIMISHIKDQLSGRKQVSISTVFQELADVNPKDIKKSTMVFNSFKLMDELERIAKEEPDELRAALREVFIAKFQNNAENRQKIENIGTLKSGTKAETPSTEFEKIFREELEAIHNEILNPHEALTAARRQEAQARTDEIKKQVTAEQQAEIDEIELEQAELLNFLRDGELTPPDTARVTPILTMLRRVKGAGGVKKGSDLEIALNDIGIRSSDKRYRTMFHEDGTWERIDELAEYIQDPRFADGVYADLGDLEGSIDSLTGFRDFLMDLVQRESMGQGPYKASAVRRVERGIPEGARDLEAYLDEIGVSVDTKTNAEIAREIYHHENPSISVKKAERDEVSHILEGEEMEPPDGWIAEYEELIAKAGPKINVPPLSNAVPANPTVVMKNPTGTETPRYRGALAEMHREMQADEASAPGMKPEKSVLAQRVEIGEPALSPRDADNRTMVGAEAQGGGRVWTEIRSQQELFDMHRSNSRSSYFPTETNLTKYKTAMKNKIKGLDRERRAYLNERSRRKHGIEENANGARYIPSEDRVILDEEMVEKLWAARTYDTTKENYLPKDVVTLDQFKDFLIHRERIRRHFYRQQSMPKANREPKFKQRKSDSEIDTASKKMAAAQWQRVRRKEKLKADPPVRPEAKRRAAEQARRAEQRKPERYVPIVYSKPYIKENLEAWYAFHRAQLIKAFGDEKGILEATGKSLGEIMQSVKNTTERKLISSAEDRIVLEDILDPVTRGSTNLRYWNYIDQKDLFSTPFVVKDSQTLMDHYIRGPLTDLMFYDHFGTLDVEEIIDDLRSKAFADADFRAFRNFGDDVSEEQVEEAMEESLDSFRILLQRVRGTHVDKNSPIPGSAGAQAIGNAKRFNTGVRGGTFGLRSATDIGRLIQFFGISKTFGLLMKSTYNGMFKTISGMSAGSKELRRWGIGNEIAYNTRLSAQTNTPISNTGTDLLSRGLSQINNIIFTYNHLPTWNEGIKKVAGIGVVDEFLDIASRANSGTLTEADIRLMGNHYLTEHDMKKLWLHFEKHGATLDGVKLLNFEDGGSDVHDLMNRFINGVSKRVDTMIVTPGIGDTRNWMTNSYASLILQFKMFGISSTMRNTIPTAQNIGSKPIQNITGLATSGMIGMSVYQWMNYIRGVPHDPERSWMDALWQVTEESGVTGGLGEFGNIASMAYDFEPGAFGPTGSFAKNLVQTLGSEDPITFNRVTKVVPVTGLAQVYASPAIAGWRATTDAEIDQQIADFISSQLQLR